MLVRKLLLAILCAAFALGSPLAGASAEPPCESAGEMPCDCESGASGCALACSVATSPASTILPADLSGAIPAEADRVNGTSAAHFASLTGPPVLQPPR